MRTTLGIMVLFWVAWMQILGGGSKRPVASDRLFQVIPGVCAGAITPASSESDLKSAYPRRSVSSLAVSLGEGETEPGTVLFATDPERRIEILWADSENRKRPKRIQITGKKSRWRTAEGITLGTTLKQLEELNGGPFTLTGFDWDYSGTVISWNQGQLQQPFTQNGRVLVRLLPSRPESVSKRERASVSGEKAHSSAEPVMQALNPRIYQIVIEFQ